MELFVIPTPRLTGSGDVLLEMLQVGICGTDRDIIENSLVDSPDGDDKLVIGHEGFARVLDTGRGVKSLKKGDFVAIIPRHGCNKCLPCNNGRSDFCETGLYTASGQHKRHGFNSEVYVEDEAYLVRVPRGIADVAVLAEPFSIIEKAVLQVKEIQKRIPGFDLSKRRAVVFGMGSVGMAAVAVLRINGVKTYVLGRRPEGDVKVGLVRELGAEYINIRETGMDGIIKRTGKVDVVIEATGATQLVIDLIGLMERNSIYVFLGIPKGAEELCFNIKGMVNKIVRENLVLLGSVNSQKAHFEMALRDIAGIQRQYDGILGRVITHRFSVDELEKAFGKEGDDYIKGVVVYSGRGV